MIAILYVTDTYLRKHLNKLVANLLFSFRKSLNANKNHYLEEASSVGCLCI